MRISHFLAQIGSFLLNKFFWYKPLLLLSSTYWPFSLCKTWPKMVHLPPKKFYLKNYQYHSRVPISPFQCAKFLKKFFQRIQRIHNFWVQNGPFPQIRIFSENLLMSLVSFIHAYLHAKNQSQILIY